MNKNKYFQGLIIYLALSLTIHFAIYLGLDYWQSPPHFRNTSKVVELTLLGSESPVEKQFVTDPEIGSLAEKLDQQAKLLSQFNRRVKKEQVARETGITKNRFPKKPNELQTKLVKKQNPREETSKSAQLDLGDLRVKAPKNMYDPNESSLAPSLPSTISEHIPNVEFGDFTVLNTDQFSYYAFFNRINQQIRVRWAGNIRRLAIELPPQIINQYASFPRVSKIELILNSKGEFLNAFVDTTSGARELDDAAINAFIDAAPYLNPPKDLIDEEGFIRLNYSFRVVWKPSFLARDNSPGN